MRAWQPDERWLIVGSSGSGKSSYARNVLRHAFLPFVILDTKGDFAPSLEPFNLRDTIKRIQRPRNSLKYLRVVPDRVDLDNDFLFEELCSRLVDRKQIGLYIDEAYQIPDSSGLRQLLTSGRSLHVPAIVCSQRPAWISRFFLSEASRFSVMSLTDARDRKTLEAVTPFDANENPSRFEAFYYDAITQDQEKQAPLPPEALKPFTKEEARVQKDDPPLRFM